MTEPMKLVLPIILILSGNFFLAACTTLEDPQNETFTENPSTEKQRIVPLVDLPDATIKAYHTYRIALKNYSHHHMVFAFDDGTNRALWLGRKMRLGRGFAKREALTNCRKGATETKCRILDINGELVLKGVSLELEKKLMAVPHISKELNASRYDEAFYRITDHQRQKFDAYRSKPFPRDSSAFFISVDGYSVGIAYNTGNNSSSRENVIRDAEIQCLIKSERQKCYLIGLDGNPVNEAGRKTHRKN